MRSVICTYCDGDYHYGAAVLINSLYYHGFRGTVWAGYRQTLPPWATPLTPGNGYQEWIAAEGCVVRFVELKTTMPLSLYRPTFILQIWNTYEPDLESIFFFDPNIFNRCSWDFYQRWVKRGIALCGDSWYHVPADHPRRLAWKEFAESQGFVCERELNHYYNDGFIGIPWRSQSMLLLWQKLIERAAAEGFLNLTDIYATNTTDPYPYFPHDQTALNLTLMLIPDALSTVGPDGMDFLPGGTIMSHAAVSQAKPWRKPFIRSALQGMAPTLTDKLFWQHTQQPIRVYSTAALRWKQLTLYTGAAIGRFIRRS
ncbi:MAG: hypothetical protein MUF49_02785 [Oculatellaceae cyanobacterium Prado106]|jgi:hypothetical protein|nr:hypothetical protein [Oculatellaceae cyanobacterium Prado106]